ncbi:MAG TPA: hypothetical protein VNH15_07470 [Elusimicrobiota bacterium]|nr:hypothetical protein [Elusimicrobiota bacterium]
MLSRFLPPVNFRAEIEPLLGKAALLGRTGAPLDFAESAVLVGTIRMGYGHYRMARAAATWAVRAKKTFVHDPLSIDSPEAAIIKANERLYSAASRLSAAAGGPVESAWGAVTRSGGPLSQSSSRMLARGLRRLMDGLPKEWPVVAAHPWNAHLASACGFARIVNLVPDSYPQHFNFVPKTLNAAQNEESRQKLVALGAPAGETLALGHWVPAELVENAPADCEARLARLRRKSPLRLLFSVGGAGAQGAYLEDLFARLAPRARRGRLRLIINAGDHARVAQNLERCLSALDLKPLRLSGGRALDDFIAAHPLGGAEMDAPAVLVSASSPLEAVAATDELIRAADVLATKPSELAFFPAPKLHIRRVGDHEAASAVYSAALGDGTPERREPAEAAAEVEGWLDDPAGLARMNESVKAAALRGVYSGAQKAVALALGGTEER